VVTYFRVLALVFAASALHAGSVFPDHYNTVFSFADDPSLVGARMTIAWDGTSYWAAGGGGYGGVRESRYNADGSVAANYTPGLDFRAVFSDGEGNVYARAYNDSTIYRQTSPGVFSPIVTLQDGTLDPQGAVVLNGAGTEYIAMSSGTVYRWNLAGVFLNAVTLEGFGSLGTESWYPQSRGIAAWGSYWLTYADEVLSAWDATGRRVDTSFLPSAGTSSDANFSFSVANGMFLVESEGTWRGYATEVPEPAVWMLLLTGLGALAAVKRLGTSGGRPRPSH
jgi:hypothetical protein